MKIKFSNRNLVILAIGSIGSIIFGLVIWQIIDGLGKPKPTTGPETGDTISPKTDDTTAPAPNTDGTIAPTPGLYPDFPEEWKNFKIQVRGTPNGSWKSRTMPIGGAVHKTNNILDLNRTGVFFEDNKRVLGVGRFANTGNYTLEDLKNDGPFDYVIDCNRDSMTFMCNAYLNEQKISWFSGRSPDLYSDIKKLDRIQKQDGVTVIVTYN
jgi:hypothetical protein